MSPPVGNGSSVPLDVLLRENLELREQLKKIELEKQEKIDDKLEAVGALAGEIAHDYRNHLAAINNFLSLIYLKTSDAEIRSIVENSKDTINKAKQLSDQLLVFSKGGSPVKELCSVRQIVEIPARSSAASGIDLDFRYSSDLCKVEVDRSLLGLAVRNIVANASESMPSGGQITVAAYNEQLKSHPTLPAGRYVVLEISDTGVGIPPADLTRIIDPFYSSRHRMGLGLSVTYRIVKNHGGILDIRSEPGKGTTVIIYLPAGAPEAHASLDTNKSLQRKRILILEDEEHVAESLSMLLECLGFETEIAVEGQAAADLYAERLSTNPFHLGILDLTINGGKGGIFAKDRIRELHPGARLIVSSGYSHDQIMSNYRENGFDDTLPKPYQLDQLESVISKHL